MDEGLNTFTGDHASSKRPVASAPISMTKVFKHEDADGIAMNMEHVVVADPVFGGTRQDCEVIAVDLA